MKLVILAAGKGKRMGESSNHTPKPILLYKGKTLIHHKLEQMPADINEIIIVIGHLGEKIVETIGKSYTNRASGNLIPVTYIKQDELLGTGHSLWQAKEILTPHGDEARDVSFIVLMGDDLYSKEDMENMIAIHRQRKGSWIALVSTIEQKMSAGKCVTSPSSISLENIEIDDESASGAPLNYLVDIVEDPEGKFEQNIMYTGGCLLTSRVFDLPLVKVSTTEYGLPQTFIQRNDEAREPGNIFALEATYWKRITAPEDLSE